MEGREASYILFNCAYGAYFRTSSKELVSMLRKQDDLGSSPSLAEASFQLLAHNMSASVRHLCAKCFAFIS
jgi:hypothetical protein